MPPYHHHHNTRTHTTLHPQRTHRCRRCLGLFARGLSRGSFRLGSLQLLLEPRHDFMLRFRIRVRGGCLHVRSSSGNFFSLSTALLLLKLLLSLQCQAVLFSFFLPLSGQSCNLCVVPKTQVVCVSRFRDRNLHTKVQSQNSTGQPAMHLNRQAAW